MGKKTNHSLRTTGASELFVVSVPEHLIQQCTGHRSIEALRLYEWPTEQQQQAVSDILSSTTSKVYTELVTPQPQIHAGFMPQPSYSSALFAQNIYRNCTVNVIQTPSPAAPSTSAHSVIVSVPPLLVELPPYRM